MFSIAAMTSAAGLIGGGASGLFQYNQGLWQFDKGQRQNCVYQGFSMGIQQVQLWREDLRDLFDLTNTKMDNYTTVSTLVLGFTIGMFIDFHLAPNTETWIYFCGSIFNAASFAYALLAMVFSMYASILCQQFQTKCMTEIVRLPIPSSETLTKGSAFGRQYENVSNVRTMLRLPVLGRMLPGGGKTQFKDRLTESPHIKMFQEMQYGFVTLADFSRTAMITSLTSLTYSIIYLVISRHLVEGRVVWASAPTVLVLTCVNLLLQKLDFMVSQREWLVMVVVHCSPTLLAYFIQVMTMVHHKRWSEIGPPFVFFFHAWGLVWLLRAAENQHNDGDSKFRLTILQRLQFPKETPEQMAALEIQSSPMQSGTSFQSSGSSYDNSRMDSLGSSMMSVNTDAPATKSMSSLASVDQQQLMEEVRSYHRSAAALLQEFQQALNDASLADRYLVEFKALSLWAGLPDDMPGASKIGKPVDSDALDVRLSVEGTLLCAVGHPLRLKQGQTVFHLTNRCCALCRRDLLRTEERYTCDHCTKYDVCPECTAKDARGRANSGVSTEDKGKAAGLNITQYSRTSEPSKEKVKDDLEKTERLLKAALGDLRKRIPKLEDSKDRPVAKRRRPSLRGVSRRDSDDDPLEVDMDDLPNPINQERLNETMLADATQDIRFLPWAIFRSLTAVPCSALCTHSLGP